MPPVIAKILASFQYLLPHHLLSRVVFWLMRCQFKPLKNLLIVTLSRVFNINRDEVLLQNNPDFIHFNAFFTRALKPGARPVNDANNIVTSPADGLVSEAGLIKQNQLIQAKGKYYATQALLAGSDWSSSFDQGIFNTIYLSPRDYHRIHMPLDGTLIETRYVPGRLFSVAPYTVQHVDQLFARNERLVCLFETEQGKMALVLVGAMLVSGIETVWDGVVTPRYEQQFEIKIFSQTGEKHVHLKKGAELGRFNMGSTVILLMEPRADNTPWLQQTIGNIQMGQALLKFG